MEPTKNPPFCRRKEERPRSSRKESSEHMAKHKAVMSAALIGIIPRFACNLMSSPGSAPAATATATPSPQLSTSQPTTDPASAPTPTYGVVQGQVCYPSEPPLPAMTLYFENTESDDVLTFHREEGEGQSYRLELPPGTYVAYAWRADGALGGSYSQAVPCGLTTDCTDHSLLPFDISAGGTVTGIEICDWYGDPGDVPTPWAE